MSRIVRKPDFFPMRKQRRSNCEADQCLCFRYTDSTISLLLKSKISSFSSASLTVQVGLCQTWSETPKTGFLASRLICFYTEGKFTRLTYSTKSRSSTCSFQAFLYLNNLANSAIYYSISLSIQYYYCSVCVNCTIFREKVSL